MRSGESGIEIIAEVLATQAVDTGSWGETGFMVTGDDLNRITGEGFETGVAAVVWLAAGESVSESD